MSSNKRSSKILAVALILIALGMGLVVLMSIGSVKSTSPPKGQTTPIATGLISASIWQALYITPTKASGVAPYWANAQAAFNAANIFGSPTNSASDFSEVATMQNNIYMKTGTVEVTSWTFSCQETIVATNLQGNIVSTVVNRQTVNANGNFADNSYVGKDTWITGATVTGSQLQTILGLPAGQYHIVITLSNINLSLMVGGVTRQLVTNTPSDENTLSWLIKVT